MTTTPTPPAVSVASWVPVAAVATTLVLWASAFVAIRHLGEDFSPGSLALGRLLVASALLAFLALRGGVPRPTGRQWVSIVTIGVLWFGVYMVALNEGERHVDAGTAAMLIQVSPVVVALLAASFLGERFTPQLAVGLALAFGGVAVIASSGPGDGQSTDLLGVGLCLLSAVVYAVSLVVQKPLVARMRAAQVTWLACSVGAVVCLPFAGALVSDLRAAPASSVGWLVYLGAGPTAVAFATFAFALQRIDASRLAVTTYLVPPITVVLSLVLLGEVPAPLAYVGGALALVGVAVTRAGGRRPTAGATPTAPLPDDRATTPSPGSAAG